MVSMSVKRVVKRTFRYFGYDLTRLDPRSHVLARRGKFLRMYNISLVLDVGANTGQYGKEIRELGYTGRIVSFEPMSAAYKLLQARAESDESWETLNIGLGEKEEQALINISKNSYSSSLLENLPANLVSEPDTVYIGQERIEIRTLDTVIKRLRDQSDRVYLKIDAQGYEDRVLKGASEALRDIDTVQLEMTIKPLYSGGLLFDEMHRRLNELGYRLVSIEPGFADRNTCELLQYDGIYHRDS